MVRSVESGTIHVNADAFSYFFGLVFLKLRDL